MRNFTRYCQFHLIMSLTLSIEGIGRPFVKLTPDHPSNATWNNNDLKRRRVIPSSSPSGSILPASTLRESREVGPNILPLKIRFYGESYA
jgi:hypothetical protein